LYFACSRFFLIFNKSTMPNGPSIHSADPPYAPPVLRAASPSSSIGTDYGDDQTSPEETQMNSDDFDKTCHERLKLDHPNHDEVMANHSPLLPKPKNPKEETILYAKVMQNLRNQVKKLRDDEIFQQTMQRASQMNYSETPQPSSNDIDTILQSMMGYHPSPHLHQTSTSPTPTGIATLSNPMSPVSPGGSIGSNGLLFGAITSEGDSESQSSTTTTGRRPGRSKGKGRRA